MTITTTILEDTAEYTKTLVVDTVKKSEATTIVYKPGSLGFNAQAIIARSFQAITDCNTAETLLNANGWDGLTPAQRKAISLGIIQALRAQARLNLNQFDAPA